jgi:hypothetical protein
MSQHCFALPDLCSNTHAELLLVDQKFRSIRLEPPFAKRGYSARRFDGHGPKTIPLFEKEG